jgi:hypothetical protein
MQAASALAHHRVLNPVDHTPGLDGALPQRPLDPGRVAGSHQACASASV